MPDIPIVGTATVGAPGVPRKPILLITGSEQMSTMQELEIGFDDFIRKPINLDRLLARIQACWR